MTERKNVLVEIITNPQSAIPLAIGITAGEPLRKGVPASGYSLRAYGGTGGYVYALLLGFGTPPPGMAVNADGTITGTPTATGTFTFQVQVQDTSLTIAKQVVTLRVIGLLSAQYASPPPLVLNQPLPNTTNYRYYFGVTGLVGAPSWSIVAGSVPAGLSMVATGASAGMLGTLTTRTTAAIGGERFYFTVRCTDLTTGESLDIDTSLILLPYMQGEFVGSVTAGYPANTSLPACIQGQPTDYVFNVTDGTAQPPFSWRWFGSGALNDDVQLIPFNGTKSCRVRVTTLQPIGSYTMGLTATDASGKSFRTVPPVVSIPPSGSPSFAVIAPQNALQFQKSAVAVGTAGPFTVNFDGAGYSSVTMAGNTLTVQVPLGAGGVQGVTASAPIVSGGGLNPIVSHAVSGAGTGTLAGRITFDAFGHIAGSAQDFATAVAITAVASVNYSHTDFAGMTTSTDVIRFSGTAGGASGVLGLFASPRANQIVMLVNASTTTLTLNNQSATETTAAARFAIGANFAIAPDHSALLWYDATTARWRIASSY